MKCLIFILILTLCGIIAVTLTIFLMQKNNEAVSPEYNAIVVEYHPVDFDPSITFNDYMLMNVQQYLHIIDDTNGTNADIIVFPEAGITGTRYDKTRPFLRTHLIEVPDPLRNVIPFRDPHSYHQVLRSISFAAYSNQIYVVINLSEKYNCSTEADCPEDGYYFYNTNVVFNRSGSVVARYRKYNLFLEPAFSTTPTAEISTFETDFGVRFGMFICFDILFEDPAIKLLQSAKVTDIIFSAAWHSELPFLHAVGVQAGWSYSMDVNLLAAGLNFPQRQSGGSGIYAGRGGSKISLMPRETGTKVLSAKVPIRRHQWKSGERTNVLYAAPTKNSLELSTSNNYSEFEFLSDSSLSLMNSELLIAEINDVYEDISKIVYETELNYSVIGFESSIKVKWSVNQRFDVESPRYRLFAYYGERSFSGARTSTIAVCGVIACKNQELSSCGLVPNIHSPIKTTFHSIDIKINSSSVTEGYIPITSNFSFEPLPSRHFKFTKEKIISKDLAISYNVQMSSLEPLSEVQSFAVYKIPCV